ncbi:MAG: hypothetical protein IJY96_04400 [Oscillospiraceae bacterium]|nr:hypothetical protein [Oscillospiraceae bacterium]
MADRVLPGPVENEDLCRCQHVNIHTMKITDACRDKDCIEDLRVYPTVSSQAIVDSAFSIRPCSAELIYADVNVDPISFNRGYYTVDVSYFYRIVGETFPGGVEICGLAVFDKRVILFGSEGNVKTFSSTCGGFGGGLNHGRNPIAVVEAVDPIALNMRIVDSSCLSSCDPELRTIPDAIIEAIGEELVLKTHSKKVYVTLGQFSMIRLERDTQLCIEDFKYFVPDKECVCSSDDDPCTLFSRVGFPTDEFFPPDSIPPCDNYKNLI